MKNIVTLALAGRRPDGPFGAHDPEGGAGRRRPGGGNLTIDSTGRGK